jgi:hypothetical protein
MYSPKHDLGVEVEALIAELQRRVANGAQRRAQSYTHYVPSLEHVQRRKMWPKEFQIPREQWFTHPNYPKQKQMPTYHVHFREEMFLVLRHTLKGLQLIMEMQLASKSQEERKSAMKMITTQLTTAGQVFAHSMETLSFHVRLEEGHYFPALQKAVGSSVDLSFLYHDHKELHLAEEKVHEQLRRTEGVLAHVQNQPPPHAHEQMQSDDYEKLLLAMLSFAFAATAFDDALLNHLGEEEELVVPISLTRRVEI